MRNLRPVATAFNNVMAILDIPLPGGKIVMERPEPK
jgi:hypothetical protein